ncbi:MAG TPA: class IV adenylate cyclase [Candidatus Dormibacteraeota bacterium]
MARKKRQLRDRSIESELKFRVSGPRDHETLREVLLQRGAQLEDTYREENYRFNGPGKSTRQTTLRLRVLDGGPRGYLTAKGRARFEGRVKIREETEIAVSDAHATLDLLTQLQFKVAWSYPKRRAMWMLDGVAVTLDELEFGHFVELEGPAAALPDLARSLGLDPNLALRESYSVMARSYLKSGRPSALPATPVNPQPPEPVPSTAKRSS